MEDRHGGGEVTLHFPGGWWKVEEARVTVSGPLCLRDILAQVGVSASLPGIALRGGCLIGSDDPVFPFDVVTLLPPLGGG